MVVLTSLVLLNYSHISKPGFWNHPIFSFVATKVRVLVNKKEYDLNHFNVSKTINETDINYSTSGGTRKLNIAFESGVAADVDVFERLLTLQITSLPSFINKTQGLLGVNNNDIKDDLTRPDGTFIAHNSSQEVIYYNFGSTCKYHSLRVVCVILERNLSVSAKEILF